jgi:hypothetical protein
MDFSVLLYMQHPFIMITRCFLRLSKARIFLIAVDHEKKAALEGAWVHHTHFQGKRVLIAPVKEWKKDLTLNRPFLEGTH